MTEVKRGARLPRDQLVGRLVELGYRRESAVSVPGDFAVRGGIVDVFGVDRARPWRAEWFGDDVEDLRVFDPATQESISKLEAAQVWPARELDLTSESVARALASVAKLDDAALRDDVREQWESDCDLLQAGVYEEGLDLFFPYLGGDPPSTLLDHLDDPIVLLDGGRERLMAAAERHAEEIENLRVQEEERGELPHGAATGLIDIDVLMQSLDAFPGFELVREAPLGAKPVADLGWRGVDSYVGRFDAFVREAIHEREGRGCVLVVSRQRHRVEELAAEHGADTVDASDFAAASTPLPGGAIVVASADLTQGFAVADGSVHVYTDGELFGAIKRRRSVLARGSRRAISTSARGSRRAASGNAAREAFVLQFAPGDLVVHRDHGISRFVEMRAVTDDGGAVHEYMLLEYAEGDRLFVPTQHLDRMDRYIGGAEAHPELSRLGSGEWERTAAACQGAHRGGGTRAARPLLAPRAGAGPRVRARRRLAAGAGRVVPVPGDARPDARARGDQARHGGVAADGSRGVR